MALNSVGQRRLVKLGSQQDYELNCDSFERVDDHLRLQGAIIVRPSAILAGQSQKDHPEYLIVLVHCNQGLSRSPGIAMLYLEAHTEELPRWSSSMRYSFFARITYRSLRRE